MEVLEALKKWKGTPAAEGPKGTGAAGGGAAAPANPPLEIRTLRGRYYGIVPVEAYARSPGKQ